MSRPQGGSKRDLDHFTDAGDDAGDDGRRDHDDEPGETVVGHYMVDDADVYIGRARSGDQHFLNTEIGDRGWLGNPYEVGEVLDREEAIARFLDDFLARVDNDSEFRRALVERCHGRTLGCWCREADEDDPDCHGDVIKAVVDNLAETGGGSDE